MYSIVSTLFVYFTLLICNQLWYCKCILFFCFRLYIERVGLECKITSWTYMYIFIYLSIMSICHIRLFEQSWINISYYFIISITLSKELNKQQCFLSSKTAKPGIVRKVPKIQNICLFIRFQYYYLQHHRKNVFTLAHTASPCPPFTAPLSNSWKWKNLTNCSAFSSSENNMYLVLFWRQYKRIPRSQGQGCCKIEMNVSTI